MQVWLVLLAALGLLHIHLEAVVVYEDLSSSMIFPRFVSAAWIAFLISFKIAAILNLRQATSFLLKLV